MIRKAEPRDLSRIAEILVFVKRMNYRSIFHNDEVSFNEIQVLKVAEEYAKPEILEHIRVYDDGIVKGLIHIEGDWISELYVDHFFQNEGIGAQLIEYAVRECGADHLWVLEKNTAAIRFYMAHGFRSCGERKPEKGTGEYVILMKREPLQRTVERMAFRQARTEEGPEIRRMYRSASESPYCTWNEYYPGEFELNGDLSSGNLFVLEEDGELVGAVSIVPENEMDDFPCWKFHEQTGEFARVVIRPDRQGKGMSRFLVEYVLREMAVRGIRTVHISVAKGNIPARRLYHRLGFDFVGEMEMYGNSYFLCEKQL